MMQRGGKRVLDVEDGVFLRRPAFRNTVIRGGTVVDARKVSER